MSPQTAGSGRSGTRKPPLRLQIPVDNPDVEAFLAAQGLRNQSQAIVMLIRMWVNEFGPTSVMEQTMGSTTLSRLKHDAGARHIPAATPAAPPAPVVAEQGSAPEIAEQPEAEPEPEPAAPTPAPSPSPAPAAPSDDIEDLFRRK